MNKLNFISLVLVLLLLFCSYDLSSQCSMCKMVAEESINNNDNTLAKGLNKGILYLLSFPYIIVGILIYFSFKNKLFKR